MQFHEIFLCAFLVEFRKPEKEIASASSAGARDHGENLCAPISEGDEANDAGSGCVVRLDLMLRP
jgi:hypothetical protein